MSSAPNRRGRSLLGQYFRSLVPSWRFFQEIEPLPELSFRTARAQGDFGQWVDALPPLPRPLSSLFLNGAANLRLREQGVLESLVDELDGLARERAPRLVSYRMVQAMLLAQLGDDVVRYQFRLVAVDGISVDEEVFRSDVHAVSDAVS